MNTIRIFNTRGKLIRTLNLETRLLCVERALYYCNYPHTSMKGYDVTIKTHDVHCFILFLKEFSKKMLKNNNK